MPLDELNQHEDLSEVLVIIDAARAISEGLHADYFEHCEHRFSIENYQHAKSYVDAIIYLLAEAQKRLKEEGEQNVLRKDEP